MAVSAVNTKYMALLNVHQSFAVNLNEEKNVEIKAANA